MKDSHGSLKKGEKMSLILEGIDLPKKNMKVICLFPNGAEELVVLDAESGATAGRPIEVIQIPKGHGRLIDESNWTTHEVLEPMGNGQYEEVEVAYKGDIDNAPTILEAET